MLVTPLMCALSRSNVIAGAPSRLSSPEKTLNCLETPGGKGMLPGVFTNRKLRTFSTLQPCSGLTSLFALFRKQADVGQCNACAGNGGDISMVIGRSDFDDITAHEVQRSQPAQDRERLAG